MKKQSNLSRLMGYAGGHKILTYLSWILSVMSALLALVPFWYIWRIVHDILEMSPDFSQAGNIASYGWSAVLFAVLSIVVYIAGLMCSHMSAFRVATNIRKELMRHIKRQICIIQTQLAARLVVHLRRNTVCDRASQ